MVLSCARVWWVPGPALPDPWWEELGSDPAGHPPAGTLAGEGIVAAQEREAGEVDVDVDGAVGPGRGAHQVDQPGVEGVPGAGRELLRLGLHGLGDPERDPGDVSLVVLLLGRGRRRAGRPARLDRWRVHRELQVAPVQPHVDAAVGQLGGDLR